MKKFLHMLAILLLALTPILLTACNKTTRDIKIATDLPPGQSVSMYVGEEKDIVFSVSDVPKNASARLMFTKDSNIISEPKTTFNAQNHSNKITFVALAAGRAEIKAIAEGGNTFIVVVNVFEKVQSFELKQEIVLVRGDSLKSSINLNSALFNFYPAPTNQTQLIFKNKDGEEITTLNASDYQPEASFAEIIAYSPHLDQEKTVFVKIINPITSFNFFDENNQQLTSEEQQNQSLPASQIFLSFDQQDFSNKQIYAQIDGINQLYDVSVTANNKLTVGFADPKKQEVDGVTKFFFTIAAREVGEGEIVFEAFYKDIDKNIYKLKRTFKVSVIQYPSEILVNNVSQENLGVQMLHIGYFNHLLFDLNVSLHPNQAKFDRVEFSYNTSNLGSENPSIYDYIEFKQGQTLLQDVDTANFDFKTPIIARGLKNTQDNQIWLLIKVFYGSQLTSQPQVVEAAIPFKVMAGASQLHFSNPWESGTIYVDESVPTHVFYGLYVNELEAYLGDVKANALTAQAASHATVEVLPQELDSLKSVKILPLKIYTISAGESRWRITLANGVSKTITINVVPKLSQVKLDFDRQNSSPTTFADYDNNNNLNFLRLEMASVQGQYQIKTRFVLDFDIDKSVIANSPLFSFNYTLNSQNVNTIYNSQTNDFIATNLTENGLSNQNLITFNVTTPRIENFLLVDISTLPPDQAQNHVFNLPVYFDAYLPLNQISFSNHKLSLYSENQLGFNYKHESQGQTLLNFSPAQVGELFKDVTPNLNTNSHLEIEYFSSEESTFDHENNVLLIPGYGQYDVKNKQFTLNITGLNTNSFDVFAKVTYYGKVYLTRFTITPQEYKRATGIRFASATQGIYLDPATGARELYLDPTNPHAEITAYVVPQNAVHKDIDYQFRADIGSNASLIKIEVNQNTGRIKISYNPNHDFTQKAGGSLYIMPRSSKVDDTTIPSGTQIIKITVGNGQDTPFRISTAEQLLNIGIQGLDKNYKIVNKIDLSHITSFSSLGRLTGTIEGEGLAEISGINIKNLVNGRAGLFTSIASTGKLLNIKISGSINITLLQQAHVGLVAGELESGARLENVSVTLLGSTIFIETDNTVNVGGVVGSNYGTIVNHIDNQNGQKFATLLNTVAPVNVYYSLNTSGLRSFVGGAVGVNGDTAGNGEIKQVFKSDNYKLYNLSNYFIIANLNINGKSQVAGASDSLKLSVGAIAGKNLAQISSENLTGVSVPDGGPEINLNFYTYFMKVTGQITAYQANNIIGGLVGENISSQGQTKLENIVSRVKIFGFGGGGAEGYLGGVFGVNNRGSVSNILIQAIEDGKSLGFDATMVYSRDFGQTQDATLSGKVNIFGFNLTSAGGEAVMLATDNFASANNLKSVTNIGATDEDNVPLSKRKFIQQGNSPATLNTYFGDFIAGSSRLKFQPAGEVLEIDSVGIINRMINKDEQGNVDSTLMAHLFYYKALSLEDQAIIDSQGHNTYNLPFPVQGEVNLISHNTGIITITQNGQLQVKGTGVVRIQIQSMLNKKVFKNVYIFASHATNVFNLYLNNSLEDEVTTGKLVSLTAQQPLSLHALYTNSALVIGGEDFNLQNASANYQLENVMTDEQDITVVLEKHGNSYLLKAVNKPGRTTFEIKAKLFADFNGKVFYAVGQDLQPVYLTTTNSQGDMEDKSVSFNAEYYVGAKTINASTGGLVVEPLDNFKFEIELETDMFEIGNGSTYTDHVILKQYNQNQVLNDYFTVVNTGVLYNIVLSQQFAQNQTYKLYIISQNQGEKDITLQVNGLDSTITVNGQTYQNGLWLNMQDFFAINHSSINVYSFRLENSDQEQVAITSVLKLNKIKYLFSAQFNLDKTPNYQGDYVLALQSVSNNAVTVPISVKLMPQSIGKIIVSSFEGSTEQDIATGKEEHNFLDPTAKNRNHFRVSVHPLQAEYDYIEIQAMGGHKTILSLIDKTGKTIGGGQSLENGLIINKNLISSDIYVRYAVERLNLYNGDIVSFQVRAFKNGSVIYTAVKDLTVKFKQDVSIEIVGKKENNEGDIYLTRGSSYNFNLSASGYLPNEIKYTTSVPNLLFVNLTARTITVTSSVISYPLESARLSLSVYGEKIVNGEIVKSTPQVLSFVIVEYLILNNTEQFVPVKGASNKIANVSIGDTFVFEAEFLQGQTIEYSQSAAGVRDSVSDFANRVTLQGTWQYQIGVVSAGQMEYSDWQTIGELGVNLAQSNGYFTINKKDGRFVFTPHKIADGQNPPYRFRLVYGYRYQNGRALLSSADDHLTFNQFTINVYQMSAIDTPTPIYTSQQFLAMNPGAYYILMEDITLPHTFQPIATQIGGLDGNNKKIVLNTNLALEAGQDNFGIFSSVAAGTLIRNLNIEVTTNIIVTLTKSTSASAFFGLLAGQNNGIVSNVSVSVLPNVSVRVVLLQGAVSTVNYVAGLVGNNTGFITNSRVSVDLYSASSISGFVGNNSGKIANSYVYNSLLVNTSSELENKTAGFVINNMGQQGEGGQITGSYVSGAYTNFAIYANHPAKIIQSSRQVGGFVYENNGFIANSYSNIPIATSSTSAGFVYINNGIIKLSYSTSQLKERSTGNYGFIFQNTGTLENNFFLKDTEINDTTNTANIYDETNPSSNIYQKSQLYQLTINQFANKQNFKNFIFTQDDSLAKGVWFMPVVSNQAHFNNPSKSFTLGRPELVAANLLATSELEVDFDKTVEDERTGEVVYIYKNAGEHPKGSTYNPHLIRTAQEFETTMLLSGSGNLNTNSFRIVADIDYGQEGNQSNLYNMMLSGDIEGNGMEIKNFTINTHASLPSAGLFSKIGNGLQGQGSVKNLTLKPAYVNLPNAISVGVLAGTLDGGTVFNVNVDGSLGSSTVIIVGKNIVGGLVGRAENNYIINTVSATISVLSSYRSPTVLGETVIDGDEIGSYFLFRIHSSSVLSKLSYAGGIAGVLGGFGEVTNIEIGGTMSANGEWASLMFGGVGDSVLVKNLFANISSTQIIQGAVYSAVISAEFYGSMHNVTINAQDGQEKIFKTNVYKPYAIGGVIGLMGTKGNIPNGYVGLKASSGIKNITSNLSIQSADVAIVGGIVGELLSGSVGEYEAGNAEASKVNFTGNVSAKEIAGGLVGKINLESTAPVRLQNLKIAKNPIAENSVNLSNIHVSGGTVRVENDNYGGKAYAGGIIGQIFTEYGKDRINVSHVNSYNQVRISSIVYGENFAGVYAGGIIGFVTGDSSSGGGADNTINLSNTLFTNRIVVSMRDLKLSGLGKIETEVILNTGFGFNVGGNDNYVNIKIGTNQVVHSGSQVVNYKGEVSSATENYFLFSYVYLGQVHNHEIQGKTPYI